ncbi:MAG: pilus motility taxis protein HmpF [Cyanophyceae cyanobacterium]
MLYLAEVVQKRGLMGSKAELKLLACQKGDQWNAASNEPAIAVDDIGNHKDGSLVMVEVVGSGGDRRAQRIKEGARQLVTLLQSYSRQQEKSKSKEEEIQQWMESLTFQSQELNRREMEMESRREELEQIQQESQNLERQRQEAGRLNQEIEHKNQELKQAWDQLRGEQQRLEQERSQIQDTPSLDPQQAQTLQNLTQQIAAGGDASSLRPAVETCLQIAEAQGTILAGRWEAIEAERQSLSELQGWIDAEVQALNDALDSWRNDGLALAGDQSELRAKQVSLEKMGAKKEELELRIQGQQQLKETLDRLAAGEVTTSDKVDIAALEAMDLGELEKMVGELKRDLDKMSQFVKDQEEELGYQQEAIQEVQEKMNQANEYDRIAMEPELADEKESYDKLNESLLGIRRNLNEREEVFHLNEGVLRKRQGLSPKGGDGAVDLTPVVGEVTAAIEKLEGERDSLDGAIATLKSEVESVEIQLNEREGERAASWGELQARSNQLLEQQKNLGDLQGKVSLTDDIVQPTQDQLDGLQEHLRSLLENLEGAVGPSEAQQGAIAQIQSIVASLA